MKRLILIIIGVLLCTPLYSDMNTYVIGSGVEADTYSDDFTGNDDTYIDTHDSAWDLASGVSINDARIYSNALRPQAWRTPIIYYNTSTSDTSQVVLQANLDVSAQNMAGPTVRTGDGVCGYGFVFQGSGDNWTSISIQKGTGTTWGEIGGGSTGQPWSRLTTHTLKIVVSGTSEVSISCYVDGSLAGTDSDESSTIESGHPGIRLQDNTGSPVIQVDDWQDH